MEEIRDEISVASVGSMLKDVSNLVESMLNLVKRFYHPFEEPAIKAFRDQLQQCITKVVDDFTVKSCPKIIIIDDDDIKEEVKSESVYDDPPNDHPMINLIDANEDNRDETQKTLEEELLMAEPSSSELLRQSNEVTAVHKEITDNDNIIAILLDYHNDIDVQNEALDANILSDRDYAMVDDRNNGTNELNGEESQMQEPTKVISSSDHSNIHSGGQEFVLSHENNNVQFDPLMEYQTELEIEYETLIWEIPIQEEVLTSRYDDGAIESMSNTSSVNNAESTVNIHAMEDVSSSNQDNAVDKSQHLRNRTSKRKKVEADNVRVAHKLGKRTLKQKKMADDESEDDSNANTSFEIVKINKGLKVYTGNERNRSLKSTVSNRFERNTGEKPHHCKECNKSFADKSNLYQHLRTHTGEKPHHCKECSKSFTNKYNLSQHLRTHTGEKPHHCKECNKSFSQNSNLSQHLRTHTGEKPHHCKECNKSFADKSNLSQHLRTHTGEKPHHCKECNKSFSQNSNLSQHLRTHTGEKPHHCKECNKSFSQNSNLSQHLRTHTGEKPHHCKECNKSFSQNSNLSQHLRTHTGEKPHRCKECSKSFSQKYNLSQHLRIHTEKPYKCNVCHTSFRHKASLSTHLQIHTGEKQLQRDVNEKQLFSCDYCGQKDLKKTTLESHILMCYKNHSS